MNNLLIYPDGHKTEGLDINRRKKNITNLRLDQLTNNIFLGLDYAMTSEQLYELTTDDPETIKYRIDIINDLLICPELSSAFFSISGVLKRLKDYTDRMGNRENPLCDLALRYYRLLGLTEILSSLKHAFDSSNDQLSDGIQKLKEVCEAMWTNNKLPLLIDMLGNLNLEFLHNRTATFGFNTMIKKNQMTSRANILAAELTQFVLESVSKEPFKRSSLLYCAQNDEVDSISGVKQMPSIAGISALQGRLLTTYFDYYLSDIKMLKSVLDKYSDKDLQFFADLEQAFTFYAGAINIRNLLATRGFNCCKPKVINLDRVQLDVTGMYPIELALNDSVVTIPNDSKFGADSKFYILTGANSSGKTVFLTATGQLMWLSALGFYLPCRSAEIAPTEGIFTIFSGGETDDYSDSRMGDEIRQLKEVLPAISNRSFVIFNEPMISTSPKEGSRICANIIKNLLGKSVIGILATHFFELFELIPEIELNFPGRVGSLVTQTLTSKLGEMATRTYKVSEGKPMLNSFAFEIAAMYQVTMKQIIDMANQRGSQIEVTPDMCEAIHKGSSMQNLKGL